MYPQRTEWEDDGAVFKPLDEVTALPEGRRQEFNPRGHVPLAPRSHAALVGLQGRQSVCKLLSWSEPPSATGMMWSISGSTRRRPQSSPHDRSGFPNEFPS